MLTPRDRLIIAAILGGVVGVLLVLARAVR